jgi:hypothetical protein
MGNVDHASRIADARDVVVDGLLNRGAWKATFGHTFVAVVYARRC